MTITSGAAAGGTGAGGGIEAGVWRHTLLVVILIISILIAAAVAILISKLHDELVVRLDHSFKLGLLLPQLLGVFSILLA
jgi:hypothetical protein